MEAKAEVLKRLASSGALDALPLHALKLYLLLIAWAKDVGGESRLRLQTIQQALGKDFSREDCQRAMAVLATHRLLTWTPVSSYASRRQRANRGGESLEIVFRLSPLHELSWWQKRGGMMSSAQELNIPQGRILVVDDDPSVRAVLTYLFEQVGLEVRVAPDGPTALAVFHGDPFEVVFVNLCMPGMTGLEVAAAMRRTDPAIPIILVTGLASTLEAGAIAQAGVSRVLPKPFGLDDITACLNLRHTTPASPQSVPPGASNHPSPSPAAGEMGQ